MNKKIKNIAITTFALSAIGATFVYLKYKKIMKELDEEEYEDENTVNLDDIYYIESEDEMLDNKISNLSTNKGHDDGKYFYVPTDGKVKVKKKYYNLGTINSSKK